MLGGVPQPEFVGDAAWEMGFFGNLDFFGSLEVWMWVFLWGASCGAGVCRPFSVLIRRHDGFLGVLLVELFHGIVWSFLDLHGFVRRVYVGFVYAGILIFLLSSFQIFSVKVAL